MFAALSDNSSGIPMRTIKVCCMHAVWQWRRNNLSERNVQLWRTIDTNSQLHSYVCGKLFFYSCVHLCKSASHEWSSLDFKASCSFMSNVFLKLEIFRENFRSARSSAVFVTFNYGAAAAEKPLGVLTGALWGLEITAVTATRRRAMWTSDLSYSNEHQVPNCEWVHRNVYTSDIVLGVFVYVGVRACVCVCCVGAKSTQREFCHRKGHWSFFFFFKCSEKPQFRESLCESRLICSKSQELLKLLMFRSLIENMFLLSSLVCC